MKNNSNLSRRTQMDLDIWRQIVNISKPWVCFTQSFNLTVGQYYQPVGAWYFILNLFFLLPSPNLTKSVNPFVIKPDFFLIPILEGTQNFSHSYGGKMICLWFPRDQTK